jgi:hypothetical protein
LREFQATRRLGSEVRQGSRSAFPA